MTNLDATDARLLLALSESPRATGVELAARLGLSRNTVQARLSRWESSGALGTMDRRVSPRALGYPLSAYVATRVDQHQLDGVVDALADIPEVVEVSGMTGQTDLSVKVVARDADDLYRLAGLILEIPGVERTNMALVMRELVGPRLTPLLERLAGSIPSTASADNQEEDEGDGGQNREVHRR
ncbi:Lrp/AsnC family transcriptional regulator [Rhodococcus sp. NPDC058521]|uniref:Lrp/AsnC family transcriptional regulator n=1 Tax=Rhodococcus sp. NPDC058521 TaxID=3346536 RepID=UPI00364E6856